MQLLDWHIHLDKSLPGPLGVMGAWLHRAEIALREEIPIHQAHEETANGVHRKLEQHKVPEKGGRGGNAPYLGGIPFEFVKVSTLTLLTLILLSEPFLCVCVCVCLCVWLPGSPDEPGVPPADLPADPQRPLCERGARPPGAAPGHGRAVRPLHLGRTTTSSSGKY